MPSEFPSTKASRRAIFFDRDGVLNVDRGYVCRPEEFDWIPGAKESILEANRQGILTVVVTNQSGIARGYYSEADFWSLMDWVQVELSAIGAHLDGVYFCPHHPDFSAPGGSGCLCRKPAPGMILQAQTELDIDLSQSLLIGDSPSDFQAAEAAGVEGIRFSGGDLYDTLHAYGAFEGDDSSPGQDVGSGADTKVGG